MIVAERFLRMRELAGLEMEPLSLKGKQVDLGGIFCVTNCTLMTVTEGGGRYFYKGQCCYSVHPTFLSLFFFSFSVVSRK